MAALVVPCQHKGCQKWASVKPYFCIPGLNMTIGSHTPLRIAVNIKLCQVHGKVLKITDMPTMIVEIQKMVAIEPEKYDSQPDFARAWTELEKL